MIRVTENSVSTFKIYRVFLKIYERWSEDTVYDKLDKKVIKKLLFLIFLLKLTILKNELLFYITNNIKIYHFLLFICPHNFYKNLQFYITNIL